MGFNKRNAATPQKKRQPAATDAHVLEDAEQLIAAGRLWLPAPVRFGSGTDIEALSTYVRFSPESGH
jgi:hypothetical protein